MTLAMLTKRELLIRIKTLKEENLVNGVKYIPGNAPKK